MPLLIRKKTNIPPIDCDAVEERLRNGASPFLVSEAEYAAMGKRDTIKKKELISRAATAVMLGITRRTLLRWHHQNFGPKRLAISERRYRYRRAEVEAWVVEHGPGSHRPRKLSSI
jgi:predicted DNA-binding transcriptional regulator AlpA